MKWLYTVVYSGNVEADTEQEAEDAALQAIEASLANEVIDVEPIGDQ